MKLHTVWTVLVCAGGLWSALGHAHDELIDVVISLPNKCTSEDKLVVYNFPLAAPGEVEFLTGPKGQLKPISVNVNGDISGSGNGAALRVSKPGEYDLSSGVVDGKIQNRLVVDRQKICSSQYQLQITYELIDGISALPKLRAHLTLGSDQTTSLTPAGRASALRSFDEKYGASLRFYISDALRWFSATAPYRKAAMNHCFGCTSDLNFVTQLGLARILDRADTKLVIKDSNTLPLSSWPGGFTFLGGQILRLKYNSSDFVDFREEATPQGGRLLYVSQIVVDSKVIANNYRDPWRNF